MSETTSIELDEVKAEIARLEAELKDAKARARALRPTKAKAEPKACGCNCGELTRGGDFAPGHDARFRGQILKAIDAGDESAIAKLLARPSLLHGATEDDLRARLGSAARKRDAKVERQAEAQAKRDAPKTKAIKPAPKPKAGKPRIDKVEAQQGTKSPSVARNTGAIRLAKQRAAA
jgi:hypothetical protein